MQTQACNLEDLLATIRNKHDLYIALLANQYYLPSYSSTAVTLDYLLGVARGKYWVPITTNLKERNCLNPPQKILIYREIEKLAIKFETKLGFNEHRLPDRAWLLRALATLQPDHLYFSKAYAFADSKGIASKIYVDTV